MSEIFNFLGIGMYLYYADYSSDYLRIHSSDTAYCGGGITYNYNDRIAIDVVVTVSTIVKFNRRLKVMDDIAAKIKVLSNQIGENIYENVEEALEKSAEFKEGHAEKIEKLENLRHKYDELLSKKNAVSSRLMKAFPDMKSKHHNEILQKLKKINIRK